MKHIAILMFFMFATVYGQSQSQYFVYIQTENQQPFSVRIGDKVLSSSSSGYLVISKLSNGAYDLNIGFPKNEWPNQHFHIEVQKDAGYVLKNFDSKGWGLFNLQSLGVVMNANQDEQKESQKETTQDSFANALADVVGSPSIKEKQKVETVKERPEDKQVKKDTAIVERSVVNTETAGESHVEQKTTEESVAIDVDTHEAPVRLSTMIDETGRSAVYVDHFDGKSDTIRIFIPYPAASVVKENQSVAGTVKDSVQSHNRVKIENKAEGNKGDEEQYPITDSRHREPEEAIEKKAEKKQQLVMINSDCKSNADERDFLRLRKKMAAQRSEDNMVIMAQRDFSKHCYTTEQIKNLSVLFLTDRGRYSFYDAAYPHVSDSSNFPSLVTGLSDEYYINRFKAMIRR